MLDAKLALREVEILLDGHYAAWQQRKPARVRVYEKPQKASQQGTPALTKADGAGQQTSGHQTRNVAPSSSTPAKSASVSEIVTNVFLLLFLSVLSERFTRRRAL